MMAQHQNVFDQFDLDMYLKLFEHRHLRLFFRTEMLVWYDSLMTFVASAGWSCAGNTSKLSCGLGI